ncbi:MAG: hypothetical protein ACFB0C_20845 [Leptolyngbyaceae cyanobacterium]
MARSTKTGPKTDTQPDTTGPENGQPDINHFPGLTMAYLKAQDSTQGLHTAKAIAKTCKVDESTIRNRWHQKVVQVIGSDRTKVGGKYTDLAESLFRDYAERCNQGDMLSECWLIDYTEQFADIRQPEAPAKATPQDVPVVTTTVVPDQAASALVLNNDTMGALDGYMERMAITIADLTERQGATIQGIAEADQAQFMQEVEAAMLQGQKEGVILHAAKQQARNATMQHLNQQAIEAKTRLGE